LLPVLAFAWLSLKIGMAWAAFVFTLILFTPFAINYAIKLGRRRV
jgi:pilus assembly protein TadC